MYKGLNPGLVEVVERLKIGDGIVIKYRPNSYADRSMGYIKKIDQKGITLTKTRVSKFFLESVIHALSSRNKYGNIEDIEIVDSPRTE